MPASNHLSEIVILLCAAVAIVAVFRRIRLSPVLGYLAAGAAIGPFGLKLIGNVETTAGIAEFGVIFLLFLIGLNYRSTVCAACASMYSASAARRY